MRVDSKVSQEELKRGPRWKTETCETCGWHFLGAWCRRVSWGEVGYGFTIGNTYRDSPACPAWEGRD